ncbi:prepilin-type N-terminal cleavage/methylation domain-containing protein [Paucibacter sp. APW11]|uniref:Prepilin-type N-terminal cleavage/methylation domain-containing protein n=1 Tax=Roseateles aquae TaxID=3077235 RepID=A0ABU3PGB7_9BURK|nr:prepilin-type N-terminal cleavage/methylation domain-containing protein [Paucibacter sp. APW11]MDT9001006.1 prepilin-type N-terminal cleavage/methylation domain-containing protein [Paucibacter sp. APW11]
MKRVQQGFTLIELMIVVAIIGILAAVAIPQYRDYISKAKAGNALTAVDSLKTAVALCVQETGTKTGCSAGTNGIPANTDFAATKEAASVTVSNGDIEVTLQSSGLGSDMDGKKIKWEANVGGTAITWKITTTVTGAAAAAITKQSVT